MSSRPPAQVLVESLATGPAWLRCALQGLGAVYLPQVAVFLLGPVQECSHCVATYLRLFPLLPGLAAGMSFHTLESRLVVAGLTTLVLLAGILAGALRLEGWKRWVFLASVAGLATLNALGASAVLRA